ncbi:ATP-binding cassette domain-containing protein [Xanthocytophaga agilis]|uniref:ATP-binding cassette domain-containing protein n=1 Tax=Xanthocytophaga agilis TaxID=3048010 RepID=A0AAE3RAV5_9BACT|nr:ATP-binding cassette domain-containing protein [Xanthocytophaga agilis]MDJ1506879.1 ATP-binding cassette domain-containing protein [Xanthocytophaga agilis]
MFSSDLANDASLKNVLEVDSIMLSFGSRNIVTDCYLQCCTGDIMGLLGRNGCGKSSLLKIIFGTLETENKSIRINKQVYTHPYKEGHLIAYLPQHGFLPQSLTLKKIIDLYIHTDSGKTTLLSDERVKSLYAKRVSELSGGERRYFEVLLLISMDVKFILLDEPFSYVEPIYRQTIMDLIRRYTSHIGFIITDHDYRNIIEISDRIVLLTNGVCKHIKNLEELERWGYLPPGKLEH